MSFDLLAEFGDSQPDNKQQGNHSTQKSTNDLTGFDDFSFFDTPNLVQPHVPQHPATHSQQSDIWADFAGLTSPTKGNAGTSAAPSSFVSGNSNSYRATTTLPTSQRTARSNTLDLFQQVDNVSYQTSHLTISKQSYPKKNDTNILFDADGEQSEDDDFGDFETVESSQSTQHNSQPPQAVPRAVKAMPTNARPRPANLGATTLKANPSPYPIAPKSPSFQERNPFANIKVLTPTSTGQEDIGTKKGASPLTAWPEYDSKPPTPVTYKDTPITSCKVDEEDEWGDFADLPETPMEQPASAFQPQTGARENRKPTSTISKATSTVAFPQSNKSAIATADVPPSNIPPPSIILSVFPQLFDLPQSSLFKTLGTQPFALKNRILSDPTTIQFLQAYLLIATVAARIIAGRKLRWKRDTHLAQSMSISTAGGKGGMKLAGIDKSEAMREDREASEVVRIWKEQAGRLRSAVATANSSLDKDTHLVVPEINENMPVKTATAAEGAVSDAKACIVCGMKRNERIVKVDAQVEDSFGEFWVEHWGHRTCRNFWVEHAELLRSR